MSKGILISLTACLSLASSVMAQRAPDPPRRPPPPPRGSAVPDEFVAQYKAAGSPSVVIFTYLISTSEKSEAEAISDTGIAHRFNSLLTGQFVHSELSIRGLDAGNLRAKDDFKAIASRDPSQACRNLGREADADLAICIFLTEEVGRNDGTRYAASYDVLDVNRNEFRGTHAWDLKADAPGADLTAERLRRYATELASRIRDDIAIYHPIEAGGGSARRYALTMHGVPQSQMTAFRDAVSKVSGVKESRRPRFDGRSSVMEMDLTYVGDPFLLSEGLYSAASALLEMEVRLGFAGEGRIELWATPATDEDLLGRPDDKSQKAILLREQFAKAYKKVASPRIAVMINKNATAAQPPNAAAAPGAPPAASQPAPVQVIVQVNPSRDRPVDGEGKRAGKDAKALCAKLDESAIDTVAMENHMKSGWLSLSVRVKDLEQAWRLLQKDRDFQEREWGDRELARLLGEKEGADIVISGVGRVSRDRGEIGYTFSAVSVLNAEVLATCEVADDTAAGGGKVNLNIITRELARQAVGKLAFDMMKKWEPPTHIDVTVTGVATDADVIAVCKLLREKIPGVVSAEYKSIKSGKTNGIGEIDLIYESGFEELHSSIRQQQQSLPFQLDTISGNPGVLNLKVTGKLSP